MHLLDKYRPKTLDDIIGHKEQVAAARQWIADFRARREGAKPILLIVGPSAAGKTSIANAVLNDAGYTITEYNSSDIRDGKMMKETIYEFLFTNDIFNMLNKGRTPSALIMEDLDSLLSENIDRGGLTEFVAIIKKGRLPRPIVCTCESAKHKKLAVIKRNAVILTLGRPTTVQVKTYLDRILAGEGMTLGRGIANSLIRDCKGDYRQLTHAISELLHTYGPKIGKKRYAEYQKRMSLMDDTCQAYDGVRKIYNEHLSLDESLQIYDLGVQHIPLLLHQNYPKVALERGASIADIADYAETLSLHDVQISKIYQEQNWEDRDAIGANVVGRLNYILVGQHTSTKQPTQAVSSSWLSNHMATYHTRHNMRCRIAKGIMRPIDNGELYYLGEKLHIDADLKDLSADVSPEKYYVGEGDDKKIKKLGLVSLEEDVKKVHKIRNMGSK